MPSLRSQIKPFLILALWIAFGAGYFGRFPLPGVPGKIYLAALTVLTAMSAGGYGSLLVRRLASSSLNTWERTLFSIIAGFGIISLLMILEGTLGWWSRAGSLLIVTPGLGLLWPYREKWSLLRASFRDHFSGIGAPPLFLISAGLVLSGLLTFTPATYYDSLVYHFTLPQDYIHAGRWVGRPELIYSAFPQTMEMIWTLGMLMAGDIFANLLGWAVAVLGVLAVYAYAHRFFGRRTAEWAAALLAVMPSYLLLSSGGYVDVGLTAFSFMSFYALSLWNEGGGAPLLVLAGLLAGCAMGCKYTGAIPAAIGGIIILIGHKGRGRSAATGEGLLLYAGTALMVFSPWLIKNLHFVGNPVFPFFSSWNVGTLSPWMGAAAEGYFRGLTEYVPRSGWNLVKLLWDITVSGLNFGGGMDVLGDLGWAPLFAFLPALWLARKKSPALGLLLLYCLCFYIPWAMSRPVLRFLLPLAPFLAIAGAHGYEEGVGTQGKVFRWLGGAFLTLLLVSNARLLYEVSEALSLFRVPLGAESRTDYLRRILVNNYYPAADFINQSLPKESLTYIVGDQRGYYYNRPVLVTPVFNKNPLTDWANASASPEDLAARLKARGVTHLLINGPEGRRLDQVYHLFPFTPKGESNWTALKSRLTKSIYRDADCEVLAL